MNIQIHKLGVYYRIPQVIQILESVTEGQQLMRLIVEYLALRLRDRLLSLYRDTPEQRYIGLLETEPHLLQRIPIWRT